MTSDGADHLLPHKRKVLPVRRSASSDAGYADEAAAMSALVQYCRKAEPVVTVSATAKSERRHQPTAAATSAAHEQATQSYRLVRPQQLAVMVKALATQSLSSNQADAAVAPEAGQSAQSVGIIQSATAKVAIAAQAAQVFSQSDCERFARRHHRRQLEPERRVSQIATAQVFIAAQAAPELDGSGNRTLAFLRRLAFQPVVWASARLRRARCVFQRKLHRALAYSSLG